MRRSSKRAFPSAAAVPPPPPPAAAASAAGGLTLAREHALAARWSVQCVGIDEAGRGPLAGPVVAAALAVVGGAGAGVPVAGVRDSKDVPEEEREALFEALVAHPSVVYGVAVIERDVIDEINILQATMRGMEAAFEQVRRKLAARSGAATAVYALIDGPKVPAAIVAAVDARGSAGSAAAGAPAVQFAEPVIGGDAKVYSIAAASLIAKVTRDRIMREADAKYPAYGFAQHKGYGVAAHVAAIFKHGPCAIHRTSFNPVKTMLLATQHKAAPAPAPANAAPAKAAAARGGKRARVVSAELDALIAAVPAARAGGKRARAAR